MQNLLFYNRLVFILLLPIVFISCASQVRYTNDKPVPQISVLLETVKSDMSIAFKGKYTLHTEEADYEFGENNQFIKLKIFKNKYQLFNENRILQFPKTEEIIFTPQKLENSFMAGETEYSGKLRLSGLTNGAVAVINDIDMENYLRGVVPAEISARNDHFEAVKAQAIVARTYALHKIQQNANGPKRAYDLRADIWDQAYKGVSVHTSLSDKAIKETEGNILVYHDSIAAVFYHSTCGGKLEPGSRFFGDVSKPYLQASADILGDHYACQISPLFRWQRIFSFDEIDRLFNAKYNKFLKKNTGTDTLVVQQMVKIMERSESGRVKQIAITHADTTVYLKRFEIRRFFRKADGKPLPSNLFNIQFISPDKLIINGGGFGHGVGMCQWGAISMARNGLKYWDILVNKYFKGTSFRKVY
jgi:stage II sporulation protein D